MALPNLASTADLAVRGVDTSNVDLTTGLLAAASSIVRGAAGSPILQTTSTVTVTGWYRDQWVTLPGPPIIAVVSVAIDGDTVDDWRLDGNRLWRECGWGGDLGPCAVDVTMTHGYAEVPERIVELVCSLVGAGTAAAADGYGTRAGVLAEQIDDYSVRFSDEAAAVASAMELPAATRRWLRSQFGGGAGMVVYR